jgi:methyl-accepting chemotaxis protein
VSSGAQTVAGSAKQAKTALLAGGAAAAGLVATVALSRHQSRPKVLGVTLPKRKSITASSLRKALPTQGIRRDTQSLAGKLGKAADRADRLGQSVSRVASSVKQVSDTAGEAAKK